MDKSPPADCTTRGDDNTGDSATAASIKKKTSGPSTVRRPIRRRGVCMSVEACCNEEPGVSR